MFQLNHYVVLKGLYSVDSVKTREIFEHCGNNLIMINLTTITAMEVICMLLCKFKITGSVVFES